MEKLSITVMTALPVSWWTQFGLDYYVFSDWAFLRFLAVLVILDTLLGFIKHYRSHDVSSRAFGAIANKLLVYTTVMILSNVVSHYSINGVEQTYLQWFGTFCCTALIIREVLSIIENVEAIYPGFFPKWIIRRLKDFDSDTCKKKDKSYDRKSKRVSSRICGRPS